MALGFCQAKTATKNGYGPSLRGNAGFQPAMVPSRRGAPNQTVRCSTLGSLGARCPCQQEADVHAVERRGVTKPGTQRSWFSP